MVVFPNAKINLGLYITGRRSDGYHNIETAMVGVDWCDVLEIVVSKNDRTTLTVSGHAIDCEPEKNLVMKAVRAMESEVRLPALDIYLHKTIPDGAGMGGGSSDAAFTLTTLNTLLNLGFSNGKLTEIASKIGADCPFFITSEPALATGTGTILEPLDLYIPQNSSLLIVKPEGSVATKEAYAGVTPQEGCPNLKDVLARPIDDWKTALSNDFEESIGKKLPLVPEIKQQLYNSGAMYASMTGSGSAVYGIFASAKMAQEASANFASYRRKVCGMLF